MKNTPFTSIHEKLGAKMAEFAGYNMPISYSGINDEHSTVRNSVGVFDVSHMGEFFIKGPQALALIQKVTTNDASKLTNGKAQYSCLPNENGGIVDDLLVYCIKENEEYMLVVNASNIEKDWNWISSHNDMGAEMINKSDDMGLLAIQGPKAIATIQKLTNVDLSQLKYYTFTQADCAGIPNCIISVTGYTGSGGVELYFNNEGDVAQKLWDAIFEAGAEFGIKPIGLGARDTLRLEKGFCLYGNDIDDNTSPISAGLGWIVKFTKDFISSDKIKADKENGVASKLIGLEMIDRGIPRHGYEIVNNENEVIGHVTSGTQAPSLGKAIAMGYVQTNYAKEGQEIYVKVRDKNLKAQVVKMPFLN